MVSECIDVDFPHHSSFSAASHRFCLSQFSACGVHRVSQTIKPVPSYATTSQVPWPSQHLPQYPARLSHTIAIRNSLHHAPAWLLLHTTPQGMTPRHHLHSLPQAQRAGTGLFPRAPLRHSRSNSGSVQRLSRNQLH